MFHVAGRRTMKMRTTSAPEPSECDMALPLPMGLWPRSFTHDPDDLVGDGVRGFFGHIVSTASKYTAPHIRRDQAHRIEQHCSDSAVRAESEYRHGELALGARPTVCDSFGPPA